jgi:hypothetical protein
MYFGVLNPHLQGVLEVSNIDQIFIEYVVTSVGCKVKNMYNTDVTTYSINIWSMLETSKTP